MSNHQADRTPLRGSERTPAPHTVSIEPPSELRDVEITLVLRRKAPVPDFALTERVTPVEFAERYGADPDDARAVEDAVRAIGARIVSTDLASRRIRIAGPADELAEAFGTSLSWVSSPDHTGAAIAHRERSGPLHVPTAMSDRVIAVLGLDDRPQARANFRVAHAATVLTSYTPPQLGAIYAFPAGTDGAGHTVAIIELGGGFATADLDAYFAELGVVTPSVTAVGVDGAVNVPGGDPNGADGEVLLDIEVVGALAPAAKIVVYFAPNTDAGFLDAVATATHATPTPTAISISWGQSEDTWTAQARTALDQAFVDAVALGATVTVAAGDDGSTDRVPGGGAHVDFPASSPHALACGGTQLHADPTTDVVASETVWNDGAGRGATGGGVSDAFPRPSWQADAGVPVGAVGGGRGVPDVAANADPQTGYRVRVDGSDLVIGGTSAVAPLWAALIARIAQATGGPLGLAQPALYGTVPAGSTPPGFRDVTQGNNGAYSAGPGWDACTGLGVPIGSALLPVFDRPA
ncbi:MAG: peptidase S53 [Microbacteriaceae bacterium]|nr:MAG: peptidase S53 [Microbacteriaceae bacterium]